MVNRLPIVNVQVHMGNFYTVITSLSSHQIKMNLCGFPVGANCLLMVYCINKQACAYYVFKITYYTFEQCCRILPTYYAQIMLHKSTIKLRKFTISFHLSYLNYKIISISCLSSLAYHQQWWPCMRNQGLCAQNALLCIITLISPLLYAMQVL